MDREALAWAAGSFDGEGCFHFLIRHRSDGALDRVTQVRITQADPEVLLRFKDALGGLGAVYGPYNRRRSNWSPQWQYAAYGFHQAQAIIAMIWPWLGSVKREQAREVLIQNRHIFHGNRVDHLRSGQYPRFVRR
ncbi:MAG TPA: hypothetical protein VGS09_09290 [Actinomycetota bacterium]|nr:hypothetical protein [Actinomycetota bacterium]